jgi:ADP-heptose:LPS heptosyltransferase
MTKDKIFVIDGGAGRQVSAIPALEKYALTHPNFHIITEYKFDFFVGNSILEQHTHHPTEENLFVNIIKDGDVVMPEPYHRSEYFNQECSIAQAFHLLINGKYCNENKIPKIHFNSSENTGAKLFIEKLKREYKKDKVLVLQPFGQSAEMFSDGIFDNTNRSLTTENVIDIASRLGKDYLILCMGSLRLDISNIIDGVHIYDNNIIYLGTSLRNWAGYIKFADHFLGCDSVGQHLAKAVNQRSTVVVGGTYPINVSYPNDDRFTVFDIGKERRVYDPIRIIIDPKISEANKGIMHMDAVTIDKIIDNIVDTP